jgi:hypothetical protein
MSAQSHDPLASTTQPRVKPIVYSTKKTLEENILKKLSGMIYYIYETAVSIDKTSEHTDEDEDEGTPQFSRKECGESITDLAACVQRMPLQAGLDSDFMPLSGKICQQVIPSSLSTVHKGVIYRMLAEITTSCLDLQLRLHDPEFDIVRLKYLILALEKEGTKKAMIESVEMRNMLERMEKFKVEKGEKFVPESNWGSLFSLQTIELVKKYGEHTMYVGFEGDFV